MSPAFVSGPHEGQQMHQTIIITKLFDDNIIFISEKIIISNVNTVMPVVPV
jgi:hypothetical protein